MPSAGSNDGSAGPSSLSRFFALNSKPTAGSFPELPDLVVWFRCVLAIVYGTYLGLLAPDRGGTGLLFGLNVITFVPYVYCQTFLGADSESYGTRLLFGGIVNALALMVLLWTYFYTLQHSSEEGLLAQAFRSEQPKIVFDPTVSPLDAASRDGAIVDGGHASVVDEAEF